MKVTFIFIVVNFIEWLNSQIPQIFLENVYHLHKYWSVYLASESLLCNLCFPVHKHDEPWSTLISLHLKDTEEGSGENEE